MRLHIWIVIGLAVVTLLFGLIPVIPAVFIGGLAVIFRDQINPPKEPLP